MKKLKIIFLALISFTAFSQDKMTFESATYLNGISIDKIPRFIELHKKFTDLSMGENRKINGDWLFRHWYGSGHTFVIYQQYETMEDYHQDGEIALSNVRNHIKNMKDEVEKESLKKEWREYTSFSDGHTDEIRGAYDSTGFLTIDNVNFDVPFVMTVGRYNSSGSWKKMGDSFFDWRIKPEVDSKVSIAGGVSYHYMGSGPEVEVWQAYNSLVDFAESVSNPSNDSSLVESRKSFWSLAEGDHEDQIYLHIGHVDLAQGIFNLAGADK